MLSKFSSFMTPSGPLYLIQLLTSCMKYWSLIGQNPMATVINTQREKQCQRKPDLLSLKKTVCRKKSKIFLLFLLTEAEMFPSRAKTNKSAALQIEKSTEKPSV